MLNFKRKTKLDLLANTILKEYMKYGMLCIRVH